MVAWEDIEPSARITGVAVITRITWKVKYVDWRMI
jgi:hypothetical protein